MCPMESVQLLINGHLTLVGEEILCFLENLRQRDVDVSSVTVREFVLERLSAAAEFIFKLLQRRDSKETLKTLLATQNKLLDRVSELHRAGWFTFHSKHVGYMCSVLDSSI